MANRNASDGSVTDLTENVNFRMSGPMRAGVRRIAEQEERSEAWVIRKAVAKYLLDERIDTDLRSAA
jgi:predicted transcriptional regulator